VCYPRPDVVDAIRYLDRTGCQWAALPADFPHPKLRANYTITRRWQPGMDSDERARAVAAWRSGVDRTLGLTRPIGTA
jgi:transposase